MRAGFTKKALESFSDEKSREGIITGILGWVLGAGLVLLFGDNIFAPSLAILAGLLTAPLMVALTLFHLRNVVTRDRPAVALRFGILFTTTQFPLDALSFISIFKFNTPPLSLNTCGSIVIGLEIAYFFMISIPALVSLKLRLKSPT